MLNTKNCENKSDEEIIGLVLENPDQYLCLMERYEEKILRYIRRISSATNEDAEDLLQEVFISAYKNLNGFDRNLKFSSWIYRIAHNKTISFWRKSKNQPKTVETEKGEKMFEFIASKEDPVRDIDRQFTGKEINIILKRKIA